VGGSAKEGKMGEEKEKNEEKKNQCENE